MTAEILKIVVSDIGYSIAELSRCMGIPYRTLQDYYYGKRQIPEEFAIKLQAEIAKIEQIRDEVFASIDAAAAKVPTIITPKEVFE